MWEARQIGALGRPSALRRNPLTGGVGFGWFMAFALGYVVRDIQDPESKVRALLKEGVTRFKDALRDIQGCAASPAEDEEDEEVDE